MDNPWIIHGLSIDYPWIIHGLSMDYLSMDDPWIIHGLSMDYPWIIHGLSMDYPWIIHGHPWISMDFQGLGEPASTSWGNRSAGCGGTARPGYLNAYLIKKVRTPSGKPGWGIKYVIRWAPNIATPKKYIEVGWGLGSGLLPENLSILE